MFKTLQSNLYGQFSVEKNFNIFSILDKKQTKLRLYVLSKQSFDLLPQPYPYPDSKGCCPTLCPAPEGKDNQRAAQRVRVQGQGTGSGSRLWLGLKEDSRLRNSFPFFNRSFDKKKLKSLFSWYFANCGEAATFSLVETLQKLGFSYAMKAGISLGVDDLKVPPTKNEFLTEAVELLANTKASVNSGNVTALEEFQQFVDTWHRTSENLKTSVVQNFSRSSSLLLKQSGLSVSSVGNDFTNLTNRINKNDHTLLTNLSFSTKENTPLKNKLHPLPLFTFTEKPFNFSFVKSSKEFLQPLPSLPSSTNKKTGEHFSAPKQKPLSRSYINILNPVYMMAFSGARGNLSQVRQLVGMRGLMADPQGQLVEFPIQSNFREGLTVTEYMISCYGARKGLVDTALRTAAAGYLTRRLVDVSHHQIVRFVTCGTKNGILLFDEQKKNKGLRNTVLPSAWKAPILKYQKNANNSAKRTFSNNPFKEQKDSLLASVGRVLARDIPGIAFRNQEVDISLATSKGFLKVYETSGISIRSPLTCTAEMGICQLCYGWSVSANRLVGLGEAVGIIAAQSIGEPGTQLTMRTFHTGGVFSGDIMEECRAKHAGVIFFQTIYLGLLVRTAGGAIAFCLKTPATFQIKGENETTTYNVSANTLLFVRQGEKVFFDSLLAQIPNLPILEENTGEANKTIVSELSGEIRQKRTINPQLASLRILAGQECTQFYFFNNLQLAQRATSTVEGRPFKTFQGSRTLNYPYPDPLDRGRGWVESPSKGLLKSQVSSTTFFNKREIKNPNSFSISPAWNRSMHERGNSLAFFQEKKTNQGLVKMSWGAHRLGNNKIFSISIKGAKAQVVIPTDSFSIHQTKQRITKTQNKQESEFFLYQPKSKNVSLANSWKIDNSQLLKTQLLSSLRIFISCKTHYKHLLINSSLSPNNISTKSLSLLSFLQALPFGQQAENVKKLKASFVYSTKIKPQGLPFYSQNFVRKKWNLVPLRINSRHHSFLSVRKKKNSFYTKEFSSNYVQIIKTGSINKAIDGIASLNSWPKGYKPNLLDYSFLFWTLRDLIFFRGNYTKNNQIYSQLQLVINKRWRSQQKQLTKFSHKSNVEKKKSGLQLINFNYEPHNRTIIRFFPNTLLKVFSRFDFESSFHKKERSSLVQEQKDSAKNLLINPQSFKKSFKPKIRLQDSGEIYPLQGNKVLKEFQKIYPSFQEITNMNSGLLMHYNRVSYKLPLCYNIKKSIAREPLNNILFNQKLVEGFSEARAFLAFSIKNKNLLQLKSNQRVFGPETLIRDPGAPQIGTFINTGDEILQEYASAYCGQIIEKSPFGLTLRLTQNILYSNLKNRPAKINKNVKNGYWISKGAPLVTLPYVSNVTGDIVAGIPKIEQLFEARGESLDEIVDKIWATYKIAIVPRAKAVRECLKEIGLVVVAAIQTVYSSQGVNIADKHLEVIIRQMTRRALILDPGETEFLPEEFVDVNTVECVNWTTYGDKATYRPRLIGITKASLTSNSFLSSASFQQTARVLERETILEKTDRLLGLKERIMMGALINAGTGELKTTVQLANRNLANSSTRLVKRLGFFSRQKVKAIRKKD